MYREIVLQASTWFINILFWIGFIPQIRLNYRLKTAKGMSDLMLLGYFYGFVTYSYYVLCLDIPIAYKIFGPLSLLTVFVIIIQRFIYDDGLKKDRALLSLYLLSTVVSILLIPYALTHKIFMGNVTGWISAIIWLIYPIPQFIKIVREKSVMGFSFSLVTLVGLGDGFQGVIGILFNLPAQTTFNGVRGFCLYSVYCLMFWLYSQKEKQEDKSVFAGAVKDKNLDKISRDKSRDKSREKIKGA